MLDKKYLYSALAGAAVIGSLGAAALSFADTGTTSSAQPGQPPMHRPGVGGTVTAVNGNTVTITGKNGTTYTVDASSAAITKDETVSVSDIKVGDTIGALGTVSGTSVAATTIHDGKMPAGGAWSMHRGMWKGKTPTTTSTSSTTQ